MSIPKFWVTLKVDVWVGFDRGLWVLWGCGYIHQGLRETIPSFFNFF